MNIHINIWSISVKKEEKLIYYPVLINLQRFPCLVIGGGKVALRKVLSLMDFNTDVTVISPKICGPLMKLFKECKIGLIKKQYRKEYIKDYKVIFSATDNPAINRKVRMDCSDEGILLNVVDNTPLCDFILPANIKRGNLVVSVSSQGKAPFYTKEIKNKLERLIPPEYEELTELAGKYRKRLLSNTNNISASVKAKMLKRFLSIDMKEIFSKNSKKEISKYVNNILREL